MFGGGVIGGAAGAELNTSAEANLWNCGAAGEPLPACPLALGDTSTPDGVAGIVSSGGPAPVTGACACGSSDCDVVGCVDADADASGGGGSNVPALTRRA